jgi:hypothetical protein
VNNIRVLRCSGCDNLPPMLNFTSHEKKVLGIVLALVFVGLTVKVVRTARLTDASGQSPAAKVTP